jgi:hypothetical protein
MHLNFNETKDGGCMMM